MRDVSCSFLSPYPIKRDDEGRTVRARAFELFEEGKRPSELPQMGVSVHTLCRYFQDWKHRHTINFRKGSTPEPMQQACLAALIFLEPELVELKQERVMMMETMKMLAGRSR